MIIVAGHLVVEPAERDAYLAGCVDVVRAARNAPGCREFSVSPDLLDPARIQVFECWESTAQLDAFRGSGPSDEQQTAIVDASVAEYDVSAAPPPAGR